MEIRWRLTDTDSPLGTVLISHGYAEHSGRFIHLADALVDAGYDTCFYDHAGHGTSPGRRSCVDVGKLILDHVEHRRVALAKARTPELVLVGHSMGGLITAASSLLDPTHLRGVVLTGPAFHPLPHMPLAAAKAMLPAARMAPAAPAAPRREGLLSRDPAVEEAFDADPLTYKGSVPLLTGATMTVQGYQTLNNAAMARIPMLIMHGSDDQLTDPAGSELFVTRARDAHPSLDIHLRIIDGARHEVLNEPEGPMLMRDIVLWLGEH